jgi:hypothetical protein
VNLYPHQNTPQYQLEPYKGINSRYQCPACGRAKQFTRYIHTETLQHLSDYTGKCNRMDKCGYHYTPKQYFIDNPLLGLHSPTPLPQYAHNNGGNQPKNTALQHRNTTLPPVKTGATVFDTIPQGLYYQTLRQYHQNNFALGLEKLFGTAKTIELINQFDIGTAKHPDNGTIFWQVDAENKVRTGKVMVYGADTLKRVKNKPLPTGQQGIETQKQCGVEAPQRPIATPVVDWVHSRLKREGRLNGYVLQQCLFGLRQLNTSIKHIPIAIVESEKTAIVASVYMPGLVWMATGGAQNLNNSLLQPLQGRKIILFPDVNQHGYWAAKAATISRQLNINITVSDFMEINATVEMKANGADLADVLIKRDSDTGLALTDFNYPMLWCIE